MNNPNAALPMLGKGSILFDLFDANGNSTGLFHLGNCSKFDLDIKDEKAQLFSSQTKSVSLIASALKKRTPSVSITGTDFSADKLALVLMAGKPVEVTQAADAVVAEALASATVAKKGRFFKTAKRGISLVTIKQGATTLDAGVDKDYQIVDADRGLIYFNAGAPKLQEQTAVTIDYTPSALTIKKLQGGTAATVTGRLLFVGDPTDGAKVDVEIWKVNLNPNGTIGLISDDYGNWTLDGEILDDSANHPTEPYFVVTYN